MKCKNFNIWITNFIFSRVLLSTPVFGYDMLKRPKVKLEDIIPNDYDNFLTPHIDGKPINVSVHIIILNIRSIDTSEMSFIADIFMHVTWKDKQLRYPASRTIERIAINPTWGGKFWTPDLYFHNAIEGKMMDTIIPYVYIWMRNDSTLEYGARLSLEFSCDMTLEKFPHDTQTCDIIMKSLSYASTEMNLYWDDKEGLSLGDAIFLPQFELATPTLSTCNESIIYHEHGEKLACIRGLIHLSRRSGYYFINVYIPSVLIVFMSMLTFWIPVDAVPGRVTLGVTSLLTIITKQYQTFLPRVSYVVALNIWLSICIGFVFCGLLEYSAVVALLSHQKRIIANQDSPKGERSVKQEDTTFQCMLSNIICNYFVNVDVYNIDRVCRIAFPLVFCIHCIIYFSVVISIH